MVYGGLKICLIIYIAVSNNLIMFDTGLHASNELKSSSKEVRNLRVHIHCGLYFPDVPRSLPIVVLPPYKKKTFCMDRLSPTRNFVLWRIRITILFKTFEARFTPFSLYAVGPYFA